jgi:predicted nucleic acid-binding protein
VIYIDTNILIYLLEGATSAHTIAKKLDALVGQEKEFICSTLVIAEFLAGTVDHSAKTVLYGAQNMSYKPVTIPIAEHSAQLQQKHNIKIGDALHLATAIEHSCESFFTQDKKLAKIASGYLSVLSV